MPACDQKRLQQLKVAMLDTQENLLDFFSMSGFESNAEDWLEVCIEPAHPAIQRTGMHESGTVSGPAEQRLRLA